MKITEVFTNEMSKIEEVINNLPMEGCLSKFNKYLDSKDIQSEIEKEFIKKLNCSLSKFVIDIFMKKYENMSKEELLKEIRSTMKGDGCGDVENWVSDCSLTEVLHNYSDSDIYEDIKKYMDNTFKALKISYSQTSAQKSSEELKKQIEKYEKYVKDYNEKLEGFKTQLSKLDV